MSLAESQTKWRERLSAEGVLWEYPGNGPHAGFSIGTRHSGSYFNSDVLFEKPELHREIAEWFVESLQATANTIDAVVAKSPYSSRLAVPLAELLSIPLIRFQEDRLTDEKSVLIFADDIYSGVMIGEIIDDLETRSISVVRPICVIANFCGRDSYRGYELLSLVSSPAESPAWLPEECPLCREGSPVLPARENWKRFVAQPQGR